MITYKRGNILDATEDLICHQVNCRGVMGAGLAKQVRVKYPDVFIEYRNLVENAGLNKEYLLGKNQVIQVEEHKYICNLFGQNYYGNNPNIRYTDYKALESCLLDLKATAIRCNLSIALPYMLGCGKGNGKWKEVLGIIESVFSNSDLNVSIYKL